MRQGKKCYLSILSGFGITFILALFVSLGVYFILFILGSLPASRHLIIFSTVCLYALAFAIAKIGLSTNMKLYPFIETEDDDESFCQPPCLLRRQSLISRVFPLVWLATGIFSVLWLTPAFIIFWFDLLYQNKVIMLFAFVFSALGAIIYYFKNGKRFISLKDRFLFFIGGCAGSFLAIYISFLIMNHCCPK